MKIRMSFISILVALLILFVVYKFYLSPSKEEGKKTIVKSSMEKASDAAISTDITMIRQAISLYYSEKGVLPETLSELVPNYLRSVPVDPWGNYYKYEKEGDTYKIISAGMDRYFNTADDIVRSYSE